MSPDPIVREIGNAAPTLGEYADDDFASGEEATGWDPARRLLAPLRVDDAPWRCDRPAMPLGSAAQAWDG